MTLVHCLVSSFEKILGPTIQKIDKFFQSKVMNVSQLASHFELKLLGS